MFEYKDAQFYNEYFGSHPDFVLKQEFAVSSEKGEENLYVGYAEMKETPLPLYLRIEIPKNFPHQKMLFRSDSISGYPHHIWNGKTEHGGWFCLNAPFAQTAEAQLEQEILSLKAWVNHHLSEDSQAHITDGDAKRSLRFSKAYEWEREVEVSGFDAEARFTFFHDAYFDINQVVYNKGYIACILTQDHRLFVTAKYPMKDKYRLPYVIVDEFPTEEARKDFKCLREEYGWDDEMTKHLLSLDLTDGWRESKLFSIPSNTTKDLDDFNNRLSILKEELTKDISCLDGYKQKDRNGNSCFLDNGVMPVSNNRRAMAPVKLERGAKKIICNKTESAPFELRNSCFSMSNVDDIKIDDDFIESEWAYLHKNGSDSQEEFDDYWEIYRNELIFFAIGVKHANKITWILFYNRRWKMGFERWVFDIKYTDIALEKFVSFPLCCATSQLMTEREFFGRGAFSSKFAGKKIALIGTGAIGSMVAESLTRSGVFISALWDEDFVQPGNICRSSFGLNGIGKSKTDALLDHLHNINPFFDPERKVAIHWWKSFYGSVNYQGQEYALKEIEPYDIIIDCTASNELLHFLSYAVPEKDIISLCITNRSENLLCITNRAGNPFELRRAFLSRISQNGEKYFAEGTGCYSPTFMATHSDISSLVGLALRDFNKWMDKGQLMPPTVYTHTDNGVQASRVQTYKTTEYDIKLHIPQDVIDVAMEIDFGEDMDLGYLLGAYSVDGKEIMVTHVTDTIHALPLLRGAFDLSDGYIDYIGDFAMSGPGVGTYLQYSFEQLASKSANEAINTNNPLLMVRNPDDTLSFFLYMNGRLIPFSQVD